MILVRLAPAKVTPPNREALMSQRTYLRSPLLTRELMLIPSCKAYLWRDLSTSSSSRKLRTTDLERGARGSDDLCQAVTRLGELRAESPYKRFFLMDLEEVCPTVSQFTTNATGCSCTVEILRSP